MTRRSFPQVQRGLLRGLIAVACAWSLGCSVGQEQGEARDQVAQAPTAVTSTRLDLQTRDGAVALALSTPIDRAPRMVEVHVRWTGGWRMSEWTAGKAAEDAGKGVHVQKVDEQSARIVVFSAGNVNTIGTGDLALLRFEGGQGGQIDIVASPPMLAPAESEEGLEIGDPLSL